MEAMGEARAAFDEKSIQAPDALEDIRRLTGKHVI
jgi:hypothetical protein